MGGIIWTMLPFEMEGGVTNHTLAMHGLCTGYTQRVAYSETEQATEQPANQHKKALGGRSHVRFCESNLAVRR